MQIRKAARHVHRGPMREHDPAAFQLDFVVRPQPPCLKKGAQYSDQRGDNAEPEPRPLRHPPSSSQPCHDVILPASGQQSNKAAHSPRRFVAPVAFRGQRLGGSALLGWWTIRTVRMIIPGFHARPFAATPALPASRRKQQHRLRVLSRVVTLTIASLLRAPLTVLSASTRQRCRVAQSPRWSAARGRGRIRSSERLGRLAGRIPGRCR